MLAMQVEAYPTTIVPGTYSEGFLFVFVFIEEDEPFLSLFESGSLQGFGDMIVN